MQILYNNYIKNATITALTENPDYTFDTGLKDDRLSRVSRTVDDASQTIVFDLGSAVLCNRFMLVNHNITNGATLTLEANSSNSWSTPAFTQSLTCGSYIYQTFTDKTYRYWRLSINDSLNPDTYIQISKIFLGDYLQLPDIETGIQVPYKSNSTFNKSLSGQLYGNKNLQYKAAKVTMGNVTETERQSLITMWNEVDVVTPFWILIWEDSLTVEPPIYCHLTKELELTKNAQDGNTWNLSLEFEECF